MLQAVQPKTATSPEGTTGCVAAPQRWSDRGASVVEWVIIVAVVAVLAGSLAALVNKQVTSRSESINFGESPKPVAT